MCCIELDILIDFKPSAGLLKLEAHLANSWVLDKDCHLSGDFALYIWTGGEFKGDFVISLGGYHPDFVKPSHYPAVKRLSLNWHMSENISAWGELYFAITPSAFMVGGMLQASYRAGIVGADLSGYVNILIQWKPLHYDISFGIHVHAWADLGLFSVDVSLSIDLLLKGPPVHGTATIGLGPLSVTVQFGEEPGSPQLIAAWPEFGRSFLDRTKADGTAADSSDSIAHEKWLMPASANVPVPGPILHHLSLVRGQISKPGSHQDAPKDAAGGQPVVKPGETPGANKQDSAERWMVRGDELELAFTSVIPATSLEIGTLRTDKANATGLPFPYDRNTPSDEWTGKPLTVFRSLELAGTAARTFDTPSPLGIRLMGHKQVHTTIRVTILRGVEDAEEDAAENMQRWAEDMPESDVDRARVPAALWGLPVSDGEAKTPSADSIRDCVTGLRRLRPPKGHSEGQPVVVASRAMGWAELRPQTVGLAGDEQAGARQLDERLDTSKVLSDTASARQRAADALAAAGFVLADDCRQTIADFRALYATPLAGASKEAAG